MQNNITKNEKLYFQLRNEVINNTWDFFEHVDRNKTVREWNDFFISKFVTNDEDFMLKKNSEQVVQIKKGIAKSQQQKKDGFLNESKSEQLIHHSIDSLKTIEKKEIDDERLIQSIDNMIIIIETLLSSVSIDIEQYQIVNQLFVKLSNGFATLSNDLYGTAVDIHEGEHANSIKGVVNVLLNLLQYDEEKDARRNFSVEINKILQTISETKTTSEKIKSYINDVFTSILAFFLCCKLKSEGISYKTWFKKLTRFIVNKDPAVHKDFIDNGFDNEKQPIDLYSSLCFLCSHDIQFWWSIIGSLQRNHSMSRNFPKEFFPTINHILSKLNTYRNMAAHSSYDCVDDRWLLRCLETIVLFTESFGFPVEKALLEKRVFYERYRIYGNNLGKTIKNYSDVDYSFFSHTSIISVRDWKSVNRKKTTIDKTPSQIDSIHERASEIVKRVFEPRSNEANEEIDKLIDYYRLNSVLFPFFASGNGFESVLRVGYPFNPSFFVVTRKLCFSDVLSLAIECVENGLSSEQRESMIMPYDIDQSNPIISKYLIDYFAAGNYLEYDYSVASSSHFWKMLQESTINTNSQEISAISNNTEYSPCLLSNIAKTIALLSVDCFCPRGVERNRDWLRLLCTKPENEVAEIEGAIDLINEYSLFIISSIPIETTQYRFVRPADFVDRIKAIQTNKRMLVNAELPNKGGIEKLKSKLTTIYNDYLNRSDNTMTNEDKRRRAYAFADKAISFVKDESDFTLDFIAFLSSIHSI